MATTAHPQRRLLSAGSRETTVWGTALAVGDLCGILIEDDGGLSRKQSYIPAKEADTSFVEEGDLGSIEPVDFSPSFWMRYDLGSLMTLIGLLFKTAGTPANLGNGAYSHTIQWEEPITGKMAVFAIERPNQIIEVTSVKPLSWELSIADGFMKGAIGLRGNTAILTSTVNQSTQMEALTYKDRGNRIKYSQIGIKMNNQADGDVNAEDALEVSDFSMSFARSMDSMYGAGYNTIIEPIENDMPTITVKLTFPRMNTINDNYFAEFIAETEKKLRVYCRGAVIPGGGAYQYELAFYFPRLRIIEIDYPFDEIVPATITLQAEKATSTPTGMDYLTPYLKLKNKRSIDYLI